MSGPMSGPVSKLAWCHDSMGASTRRPSRAGRQCTPHASAHCSTCGAGAGGRACEERRSAAWRGAGKQWNPTHAKWGGARRCVGGRRRTGPHLILKLSACLTASRALRRPARLLQLLAAVRSRGSALLPPHLAVEPQLMVACKW